MKVSYILWRSSAQSDRADWVWTMLDNSYHFVPPSATKCNRLSCTPEYSDRGY